MGARAAGLPLLPPFPLVWSINGRFLWGYPVVLKFLQILRKNCRVQIYRSLVVRCAAQPWTGDRLSLIVVVTGEYTAPVNEHLLRMTDYTLSVYRCPTTNCHAVAPLRFLRQRPAAENNPLLST